MFTHHDAWREIPPHTSTIVGERSCWTDMQIRAVCAHDFGLWRRVVKAKRCTLDMNFFTNAGCWRIRGRDVGHHWWLIFHLEEVAHSISDTPILIAEGVQIHIYLASALKPIIEVLQVRIVEGRFQR